MNERKLSTVLRVEMSGVAIWQRLGSDDTFYITGVCSDVVVMVPAMNDCTPFAG